MGLVDCEPSLLRPPPHHPYSLRLTQDTITAIPGGPLVGTNPSPSMVIEYLASQPRFTV